jgi:amino acid transporter/thiamine kinase-like enzyme
MQQGQPSANGLEISGRTDDSTPGASPRTGPSPQFPPRVGDQAPPPRAIGPFASFALAMSTICILAGGITSFPQGFCGVGGASVGLGWPLWCLFSLAIALTMGQVASAFPRAGGPCEWAAELGGRGWGWVAGCFNLAALVTGLAAVNVGLCQFVINSLARILAYDPAALPDWVLGGAVLVATASQAFINHRGIRLTTRLTNLSGYLIVAVVVVLTGLLLVCTVVSGAALSPGRLLEFRNFSGPAGGGVWPATESLAWLFALGLLLPAYTITGFDASAQTAEETAAPEVNVPRAMWQAVLVSGLAGWVLLSAVVLAAPDMAAAAAAGEQSFFWIIRAATPNWTHGILYTGIGAAQYFCGLASVTAASRLTWAMARDGGLPFARRLRRVGTHLTPSAAIWAVGTVAVAFALFIPYSAVASVCAVFFYIGYVVPTACGLATYGRWPWTGPWHLGRWYPPLAVMGVLGCAALILLGMQPPNEVAVWVVGAMVIGLLALWFGYFRMSFRDEVTRALGKLTAFRDRHDVTATPLGGGLTNRNYRIDVGGESYVLRIAGAGAEELLIDRPRELAAALAAAAAGVAADVVEHLSDHSVLVTRFVRGKPLTAESLRQAEGLRRVAGVLRRYHDHPAVAGVGPFSAFEVVRYYYGRSRDKGVTLPADLDQALQVLRRIEDEARTADAHCLCHNDLLLGNFIDEGHALRIIDWEYAGLGDRFFDLGNFAAHNELSEAEEEHLLECYFGQARPEDLRRLRLMRLVSDLREATWGYLQSATSSLHEPKYYQDYGRRFLDQFLARLQTAGVTGP